MRWLFPTLVYLLASSASAAAKKEWTFLFYIAGDEDEIGESSNLTIKRMESVPGLSADAPVNVVVHHDDVGEDPNYRYLVRYVPSPSRGSKPDSTPINEADIQKVDPKFSYGEADTSDPATLKRFINWGIKAYPAQHYALFVVGHSWGQKGLLQDFHKKGKTQKSSDMIRLYEFRRLMEEVYRENTGAFPERVFDLLVIDACNGGQLEVAYELKDVFRYFAASTIETPITSFPYREIFMPFLAGLRDSSFPLDSQQSDELLEDRFLKPLVEQYIRSHSRRGSLVPVEKQMDPVAYFAIRLGKLGSVVDAFRRLVRSLPSSLVSSLQKGEYEALESLKDMDSNIDVLQMARRLKATGYSEAGKLEQSLGYSVKDESANFIRLESPTAQGAWVHIQIDEQAPSRTLAACVALKSFAMMNVRHEDFVPEFSQREDAEGETFLDIDCAATLHAYQESHPGFEKPLKLNQPEPVKKLFQHKIKWPHKVPAQLTETGTKRILSVWIPKEAKEAKLDRRAAVRLVGTEEVKVEYFSEKKEVLPGGFSQQFPSWYVHSHFPRHSLYVVEGHSNGTQFKHGLGVYLLQKPDSDDPNFGGRLPIEKVEAYPFALTTEDYLERLTKQGSKEVQTIRLKEFYKAHRFQETGWPEVMFAP